MMSSRWLKVIDFTSCIFICTKLQFACMLSVPELLLILLLNVFIVTYCNLRIILVVLSARVAFMEGICIWSKLIRWLGLESVCYFLMRLYVSRTHESVLHCLKCLFRFLSDFLITIHNLAASECWRHIPVILATIYQRNLK